MSFKNVTVLAVIRIVNYCKIHTTTEKYHDKIIITNNHAIPPNFNVSYPI